MPKNKNVLVTGGAGFIGSHLVEELLKANNFVVIIDNFNKYYEGKEENIEIITKDWEETRNYKIVKGDLLDIKIYDKIECEIDFIFHLAAQAGVRYSIEHAPEVVNNNIVSTINVFEYAKRINPEKICFASSSSVYGNPEYTPLDEKHPKNPISPYAVSKLCCEHYADYYYREYELPITSLRFYTVYGPRGRPDMAIRKFFNRIFNNEMILIYGDGTQLRDFTFVKDIVNGLILAAENSESSGENFNLGCSNPISVNELVEIMYKLVKKPKNLKFAEKQKGDVDVTYSDTSKAKQILKYFPKVKIEEGLEITYEWQKKYYLKEKKV